MEWDQLLYKGVLNLVRKVKHKPLSEEVINRTAALEHLKPRLTVLAQLLNHCSIAIHTAEDAGGWKNNIFFLPASYHHGSTYEDNVSFYLFRVAYLSIQRKLGLNWNDDSSHSLQESVLIASSHSHHVLKEMFIQYPSSKELADKVINQEREWQKQNADLSTETLLWGKWMSSLKEQPAEEKTGSFSPEQKTEEKNGKPMTEKDAPASEEVEVMAVNKKEQEEYTLTHNFEKVETIEEFNGKWRDFDGSDDLEEHGEALQELKLRNLVRVDNPVHSIYRADFVQTSGIGESRENNETGYQKCYDEWDFRTRFYKKDYCKMYVRTQTEKDLMYSQKVITQHKPTLMQMQKQFSRFYNEYRHLRRQPSGEEVDLDALVESYGERRAGRTPSHNLYQTKRKQIKDIAVLLLTDMSLSTDGYAGGHRILDVEKQSLILAGEVFSEYEVLFQIDGFSSRTRNNCDYVHLKHFHEPWQRGRQRIGAIEPTGYTRIGPAIRHASWILQNVKAQKHWLLILSDGKPNDYDRYEGRYGVEDVRQAIRETRQKQVQVSAIAIDVSAKFYLPKMLGDHAYNILPHPAQLPNVLLRFYMNILK